MEIIDEYQTADGKWVYRIQVDDGMLPPMSFLTKKTESELEEIIDQMIDDGVVDEIATEES